MRNRAILLLACCATNAIAASSLSAPLASVARDNRGQLRLVYGVAGNFVLRGGIGGAPLDWRFDGSGGLVKTASELLVVDANGAITARRPAPAGRALLGAESAYFKETGELLLTKVSRTIAVEPAVIGGRIVALGTASGNSIELAACRAGRLWLLEFEMNSGAVLRENAPGGAIAGEACSTARPSSLLLLDHELFLATAGELLIATSAGEESRIPLAVGSSAQPQIRQAAREWLEIERADTPVMIRVGAGGPRIYQLPAAGEAR